MKKGKGTITFSLKMLGTITFSLKMLCDFCDFVIL